MSSSMSAASSRLISSIVLTISASEKPSTSSDRASSDMKVNASVATSFLSRRNTTRRLFSSRSSRTAARSAGCMSSVVSRSSLYFFFIRYPRISDLYFFVLSSSSASCSRVISKSFSSLSYSPSLSVKTSSSAGSIPRRPLFSSIGLSSFPHQSHKKTAPFRLLHRRTRNRTFRDTQKEKRCFIWPGARVRRRRFGLQRIFVVVRDPYP